MYCTSDNFPAAAWNKNGELTGSPFFCFYFLLRLISKTVPVITKPLFEEPFNYQLKKDNRVISGCFGIYTSG